jgi:hypothetical protein
MVQQQLAAHGMLDQIVGQFSGNDAHSSDERIVELIRLRQTLRSSSAVAHLA